MQVFLCPRLVPQFVPAVTATACPPTPASGHKGVRPSVALPPAPGRRRPAGRGRHPPPAPPPSDVRRPPPPRPGWLPPFGRTPAARGSSACAASTPPVPDPVGRIANPPYGVRVWFSGFRISALRT